MHSFINDFPEDGLYRPKHVEGASQNNKLLIMVTCAYCWIKCYVVNLLHGIWFTKQVFLLLPLFITSSLKMVTVVWLCVFRNPAQNPHEMITAKQYQDKNIKTQKP